MTTTHPWNEILRKVVDVPGDVRYRVRHERIPTAYPEPEMYEAKGGKTIVEIVRVNEVKSTPEMAGTSHVEVLATGVARCHPNDNYDRKVGRDLALRAALRAYKAS